MAELTTLQRIQFIDSLEIDTGIPGDWTFSGEQAMAASGDSAAVDCAQVVAFSGKMSEYDKCDVLNSCLLAQLAANKRYDREKDAEKWYRCYSSTLENVGWRMGWLEFREINDCGQSFKIDSEIIKLLLALCQAVEGAVSAVKLLKKAMDSMNALSDGDRRLTLFECSSHSVRAGNFQVGACFKAPDSQVSMALGAAYFCSPNDVSRVLCHDFGRTGSTIYLGSQMTSLCMDVYAQVRQTVINKLGYDAFRMIEKLEL